VALLVKGGLVAAVVACQRERPTAFFADRMQASLSVAEARRLLSSA